jgi:DNA invertase Pin-like site-specific DNA recombinase
VRHMRALIAARKSNKVDTATGEGIGITTQDERSRAFCERLDWTVVGVARDVISGRVAPIDRPDLGAWLSDPAKLALFDVVVAYKTDRLSRGDDTDWSRIESWAADHGKTLVIVDSMTGVRYPARDDSDYWQWTAAKRQSGKEWADIRERITRAQCRIMRDGAWVGLAPFGYSIQGERYRKTLVIDPKLDDYVRAIFERVTAGESLRDIAAWLTAEGVPTERGNTVWNGGVLRQVILNETYTGSHKHRCADCGADHVLSVPAIVDMATQARAIAALKSRRRGYSGGGRPSEAPAMLTPTCDRCGVAMYRGGSGEYKAYYCKTRIAGGKQVGCGNSVKVAWLDTEVDWWMRALATDEVTLTVTYPAAALESEIESVRRDQRAAFERREMTEVMRLESVITERNWLGPFPIRLLVVELRGCWPGQRVGVLTDGRLWQGVARARYARFAWRGSWAW